MHDKTLLLIGLCVFFTSYTALPNNSNYYQDLFADIVLIINFNHPHYDNIAFLKELYSPIFKHIVFYGEVAHPDVRTYTHHGFLLSGVVHDALTRLPDYAGYLFLQDDCVLNFWNYTRLDHNKLWYAIKFNDIAIQHEPFFDIRHINGQSLGLGWGGWDWPWCFSAALAAYKNLSGHDLQVLQQNIGIDSIPHQMCEVFYIPRRFVESALRLNALLKDVFCEIGITTMFCCLDGIHQWEPLNMLVAEKVVYGGPEGTKYPDECDWIHPVKFSKQEYRTIVKKIFDEKLRIGRPAHEDVNMV